MTGIQLSLTFLSDYIRNKTGEFLFIWILSAILMLIPTVLFWLFHGSIVSPDTVMTGIFNYGTLQIKQGILFLKAIPPDMWQTLIIIFSIKTFSLLFVFSFIQGGVAGRFLKSNNKEESAIPNFLRNGTRNLLKMMSVNLLIALILIVAIGIGFGLGALVFVISGLIIFIIAVVILIYVYVRFAFTPFCVVSENKSWFGALYSSIDKTKLFTGVIAGIVIIGALVSQILTGYTIRILLLPELITSFILVTQLGLLAPLYMKASESK